MKRIIAAASVIVILALVPGRSAEKVRYLLAVGANHGGDRREVLRFAVSDAESFAKTMNQLGGIAHDRTTILVDPRPEALKEEFLLIGKQIQTENKNSRRTEVIFYYSGHSDDDGILLGNNSLSYKDLRSLIEHLPAEVKIAVLDSCSSGAFTRIKGGKLISPFMNDRSQDMKGFAFMTSSSADEVSQESDRIGGSFFTHYLISGLRGAAARHDGRVTLNEAYQYAYRETLTRTERTAGGAQHPNYNIQMTGTGDVILTDITAGGSLLVLSESLHGRFFINNGPVLAAELTKQKGDSLSLSLDEGKYTIVRDIDGDISETKITLKKNSTFTAGEGFFYPVAKEQSTSRGGEDKDSQSYQMESFGAFLLPFGVIHEKSVYNLQIFLIGSRCTQVNGVSAGVGIANISEDISGISVAAIGSVIGRDTVFLQACGIFCYTGRDLDGVQASGICNYTGRTLNGVQASGVANINIGELRGVQASGIFNMTGAETRGVQASGIFNYAAGNFYGMQSSSILNISAKDFSGFQLAVINLADGCTGLQLGVINCAENFDSGVQLGVINYSETNTGFPIGLISIVRNGDTRGNLCSEDTGFIRASITHGTDRIYNIFSSGYLPGKGTSGGLGFGTRRNFASSWIALEGISHSVYFRSSIKDNTIIQNQINITAGYRFMSRLAVYGGITFNHIYSRYTDEKTITPMYTAYRLKHNSFGPGIYFGIRI